MLLSGNAEVAFPSTTATTTPAANLPTPAPSTANVAAGAAISLTTEGTCSTSVSTIDIVARHLCQTRLIRSPVQNTIFNLLDPPF
jgi:hypothetical protein